MRFNVPTPLLAFLVISGASGALLAGMSVTALAQENTPDLSARSIMYSAFECAEYAEMSGKKDEQARLFEIGYKAGKQFVARIKNRTVPETPDGVDRLAGPSIDFIVGRMFETAVQHAYDAVGTESVRVAPRERALSQVATSKYERSNCGLIR
jgi:hypothetical protein